MAKSQQKMGTHKKLLLRSCSLLMASLFALSASVQFNDPDWYLWFPLYAAACTVNVLSSYNNTIGRVAKFTLWLGIFLFIKVVVEDLMQGVAGFWSLDMRERVVREKIGSGLVVISLFLELDVSSSSSINSNGKRIKFSEYGMPLLVGAGYGLSLVFFVLQKREMKF